jgi:hypothetical protein
MLTKNQYIPDVTSVPPTDRTPQSIKAYTSFLTSYRDKLASNAWAYVNQRPLSDKGKAQTMKKILSDAAFIPAAPKRYAPGIFSVEKMKYFVIHRPSLMPRASTTLATIGAFTTEDRQASTHFIIDESGALIQMVDLDDMAYHCGTSKNAFNYNSAGVELSGAIDSPIYPAQYETLAKVIRTLHAISGFLPNFNDPNFAAKARIKIVGHSEIRPGEKLDPGRNFNYGHLISLIPKVQVSTNYYKPPFDPRENIQENLIAIEKSFTPATPGDKVQLSTMISEVSAMYRSAGVANMQLGTVASMASMASDKVAMAISDSMRMQMESQVRAELARQQQLAFATVLKPESLSNFFDFKTGKWVKGEIA